VKPAPFEYYAPTTLEDALGILVAHGDDAKVLAGGQSLVPMLNLRLARFDALVDLRRVAPLKDVTRSDGHLEIGSMVRQCTVETSDVVAGALPLLAAATPLIGHFQIRNRGTVGGSIAHADPAAEYPAVALALDAEMEIAGSAGRRRVRAADFFRDTWETALAPGEILAGVRFAVWGRRSGFAVEEVARRYGDFAIAGCACGVQVDGTAVVRAAVALFGVASTPIRCPAAEHALVGADVQGIDCIEVGGIAAETLEPPGDLHASSGLRRRIAATVVRRALRRALDDATDA
jgi:aerobic carbon-monoxide dehydrogenase medium subunit